MKLKKLTGIFALFAFLFVIAMLPSKAVSAENVGTVTLGQAVAIEKGGYKEFSITIPAGQIICIDRSTYNAHHVEAGHYDYWTPEYSVYCGFENYNSDNIVGIASRVYYVKKTGTYTFYAYAYDKDDDEVTEPTGGTVTINNGTQVLETKITKGNSMGNNVYKFTPKASGTYAFTVKANGNSYAYRNLEIYTYDGTEFKELDDFRADANYSYTYGFNYMTESATLKANTTYYICGYAYNKGYCAWTDADGYEEQGYDVENGYTISLTQSPTIAVSKVTISKATSPKTKQIKVTWKKAKVVNGYEISYSTSKNMKNVKTVLVSGKSKTSKVIKGLSKKKTYYVRVRGYRTVEGNNFFGSYSKKLKVKTK